MMTSWSNVTNWLGTLCSVTYTIILYSLHWARQVGDKDRGAKAQPTFNMERPRHHPYMSGGRVDPERP